MINITITDRTLTVISHGEPDLDEWLQLVSDYQIKGPLQILDYTLEDDDTHTWRFAFCDVDLTVGDSQ